MINSSFTKFIKNKLSISTLIIFIIVMQLIGGGINYLEPYPLFWILSPTLFIMMSSTVLVLKYILCQLDNLKEHYENIFLLKNSFQHIFQPTNANSIFAIYLFIIGIYFMCLYQLKYYALNLMGAFILFLGGSTFFLALICYELYIRLTICLKELEKNMLTLDLNYNFNNPKETKWLKTLHKLCRSMGKASLVIGLLFVFENAMILWVNASEDPLVSKNASSAEILKTVSPELWFIWIFIFISIAVAFPLITIIQTLTLRKIIMYIQNDFNQKIMESYTKRTKPSSPLRLYVLLKTIDTVEKSLREAYLLRNQDRIINIVASLLTCLVHLFTFYETLF